MDENGRESENRTQESFNSWGNLKVVSLFSEVGFIPFYGVFIVKMHIRHSFFFCCLPIILNRGFNFPFSVSGLQFSASLKRIIHVWKLAGFRHLNDYIPQKHGLAS